MKEFHAKNVEKPSAFQDIQYYYAWNLFEKSTHFYVSLNSELIRHSQFYDIPESSNEPAERAALFYAEYLMSIRIAPVGSLAREFTCSKARAQCYVTLADRSPRAEPDDTKARRCEISRSENGREFTRGEESERTSSETKKGPSR